MDDKLPGENKIIPIEVTPDDLEMKVNSPLSPNELENKLNNEKDLPDPLSTPEITPPHVFGAVLNVPPEPAPIPMVKPVFGGWIKSAFKNILLFCLLFLIGIGFSLIYSYFFGKNKIINAPPIQEVQTISPTPQENINLKSFSITKGKNGELSGVEIKLPVDMLTPICDGDACVSFGSYMTGGTRFTVSYQEKAGIKDVFKNLIVTDATGKQFETKEATVSGLMARDYQGEFVGTTSGGYRFTKMHGVMVKISDTELIEINHFAPSGITTDFAGDEKVFSQIIQSFKLSSVTKSAVLTTSPILSPSLTPTMKIIPTLASSSGDLKSASGSAN
jgi:hypothetical protein